MSSSIPDTILYIISNKCNVVDIDITNNSKAPTFSHVYQ